MFRLALRSLRYRTGGFAASLLTLTLGATIAALLTLATSLASARRATRQPAIATVRVD